MGWLAVIVVVIAVICGGVVWRRRAARQDEMKATTAALGTLAQAWDAGPEALAERRRSLAEAFRRAVDEEPDSRDRASQALWMALMSEVIADTAIDERELYNVADLYGQITGHRLERQFVLNAAEEMAERPKYAIEEIARASVSLTPLEKSIVLRAACLIIVSDEQVDASEAERLLEIFRALGMTPENGCAALAEMARQAAERPRGAVGTA